MTFSSSSIHLRNKPMSHCTCDYHQEQNKKRQLGEEKCKHADPNSKVERRWTQEEIDELVECNICKPHEEKKDWEKELEETLDRWVTSSPGGPDLIEIMKNFIREKLKEEREKAEEFYMNQPANEHDNLIREAEREKWRLKNAGLYRQLFGEENRTYTSKELWEILDSYAPLFTEEQKKELKDYIMKKK